MRGEVDPLLEVKVNPLSAVEISTLSRQYEQYNTDQFLATSWLKLVMPWVFGGGTEA